MLRFWGLCVACLVMIPACPAADWFDWRGPNRDSRSSEKELPSTWSTAGKNLAWRVPHGGRSAPIVLGGRVYLLNPKGAGETLQERLMCLDADTGKVLWEQPYNVFLSDVPPHRVAWSSPAGDPQTGNVYTFGVGGTLRAVSPEGKQLWERSLGEEFGLVTTHGGRTVSPVVENDLVIVSGITSGWGQNARASQRFLAFDKATGELAWISSPGGAPFDTTYAAPAIAAIQGTRLLIAGGSDGAVHAVKLNTGEPVWKFPMSKRGINTGIVLNGTNAIVSHSEENIGSSEMGMLAAIDASAAGELNKQHVKWQVLGFQGGFSSPVVDGDRVYQIDNSSNLFAFDVVSGKRLWQLELGTLQRATPVIGDGKMYVGTENGKFFIIRPGQEKGEVLSAVQLGTEAKPEIIYASAAVSDGRIYLVSTDATYCIGQKRSGGQHAGSQVAKAAPPSSSDPPVTLRVHPAELLIKPGATARFKVLAYDKHGEPVSAQEAAWAAEGLRGTAGAGTFTASAEPAAQAGLVRATAGAISGLARLRVIPPLPWTFDFDSLPPKGVPPHWINVTGKYETRELEGGRVLVKLSDNPFTRRARSYFGPPDLSDYTIEVDVRATEKRRQMGDAGVVAQRYSLILFGNHQRLELQSWQPETARTVAKPFAWKADTWYRLKLRVEPAAGGKVRVLGKAWPRDEAEPAEWTIQKEDSLPNLCGSPGLYADAANEIFFDNLKVANNR